MVTFDATRSASRPGSSTPEMTSISSGDCSLPACENLVEVVAHRAHERLGLGRARRQLRLVDALDGDRVARRLLHEAR